jgi:hypothetical protein
MAINPDMLTHLKAVVAATLDTQRMSPVEPEPMNAEDCADCTYAREHGIIAEPTPANEALADGNRHSEPPAFSDPFAPWPAERSDRGYVSVTAGQAPAAGYCFDCRGKRKAITSYVVGHVHYLCCQQCFEARPRTPNKDVKL